MKEPSQLVALDGDSVVGSAFAFVDGGALDAYLSMMAVHANRRREGIARLLLGELFRLSGVQRIDLLAESGSEPFYESLPHFTLPGYRSTPGDPATRPTSGPRTRLSPLRGPSKVAGHSVASSPAAPRNHTVFGGIAWSKYRSRQAKPADPGFRHLVPAAPYSWLRALSPGPGPGSLDRDTRSGASRSLS